MRFLADLHTHSYLSRATSHECTLEGLHRWAQLKGVRVVGTGDCTHPAWWAELKEKLAPSGPGLYRLRPDLAAPVDAEVPAACRAPVDFMVTGEISSIYKRGERTRKVHTLLHVPDLDTAARINSRLEAIGNISSDGRPILGLDPRWLVELVLEVNPEAYVVPAHIWTPWFSVLGSRSGFDSLEECFGEMTDCIFAAETGLSSDPPMNWRVSRLDRVCLMSNSDLHSPANLGRNANVFLGEPDFFAMRDGLRAKDPNRCGGTIDLFPEEGKYHYDGHRQCGVSMEPEEALAHDGRCPRCAKPLVLGVLHRVVELADRPAGVRPPGALPCQHIIPLAEVLAEIYASGPTSRQVTDAYHRLVGRFGPEFRILCELDPEELRHDPTPLLDEAIRRVRREQVIRQAGYDGQYGLIRVFAEGEKDRLSSQGQLFDMAVAEARLSSATRKRRAPKVGKPQEPAGTDLFGGQTILESLTPAQRQAATATDGPAIIVAGPGTGKTRTLTHRIAYLVSQRQADPRTVLAVTFTNRAADEMRERLNRLLGPAGRQVTVATFHALCLGVLRRFARRTGLSADFTVTEAKGCSGPDVVSLETLVPRAVRLLTDHPDIREALGYGWVCVDEYQDVDAAQYELVRLLSPEGRGLCVIGDPDQAIYGFRGSDVSYFLRFTQDFPHAQVFHLERNFRSTDTIVTAAGQVIAPGRTPMSVASTGGGEAGRRIRFHEASTAAAEAEFIAREIERWLGGTAFFSLDSHRVDGTESPRDIGLADIAVLVRLRALMEPLAEALSRLGLPVQTVSEEPFVEHPGARAVIEALRRQPAAAMEKPAREAVREAIPSGGETEAWAECAELASRFAGPLRDFLDHLLLRQGADRYQQRAERIALMTLHAAKGLEFRIVFLAGCETGILPYAPPGREPDVAEERRLVYVGMTRAREVLYITYARRRVLFGQNVPRRLSPLVVEIEERLREATRTARRLERPPQAQKTFDFFS